MSHGYRASALGALAALLMVPLLAGCSAADAESQDGNASDSSATEEKSVGDESIESIDLAEWRDRARAAAVDEDPVIAECADLYPDSITEKAAEFVGPDVFLTDMSGLISAPSLSCEFTAEFQDYGHGWIELYTETESAECDDMTPGIDGIVADDPIEQTVASAVTASGCSADGIYHAVEVMAWKEEPRFDYAKDGAFVSEVVALMIEEQDSFLEQALELYKHLE